MVICDQCRKPFKPTNNSRGRFCSLSCYYEFRSIVHKQKKVCTICNQEYLITQARVTTSKYCSNICKNKGLKQYRKEKHPRWLGGRQNAYYRYKYGIDEEFYNIIFEQQNFSCAICGTKNSGRSRYRFHVDHDHKTNKFRGLLCSNCNRGLGYFNDDINKLNQAAIYIRSFLMANIPNNKPAYQGKDLSPGKQLSQGRATQERALAMDLRKNEPKIPVRKLNPKRK